MGQEDRIGRLKDAFRVAMDSLTHTDYVGVIQFNSFARSYEGLTTLAKALPGFRERLVSWVDGFRSDGSTNFQDAFRCGGTSSSSSSSSAVPWCPAAYRLRLPSQALFC